MTKVKTTCRLCLVRCGMVVETDKAGKVKRITGDRSHPLSKGYLCVKGNSSLDFALSPKRIIYPMKRLGERGSGRWQRVSWDDALHDIARRLKTVIDTYGARAVAVQALPPKEYFAYDMFCDVHRQSYFLQARFASMLHAATDVGRADLRQSSHLSRLQQRGGL